MTRAELEKLRAFVAEDRFFTEEPMARHTTFRIGGPAEVFLQPADAEEIRSVLRFCKEEQFPVAVIGNGSNLLVSDAGFRGVIVQLDQHFQRVEAEGKQIRAEAGALLSRLAHTAKERGLTGLEYASGIPGSVGGAVVMNAGAYGGEIKDSLVVAVVLTGDLEERVVSCAELDLGYRYSRAMQEGWTILQAVFALSPGDPEQIEATMADLRMRRTEKQPLEFASAGSTFKRPPGQFAGKLIMEAGLAGARIGDAQISEKHCGFLINRGNATAEEVRALIAHVQETVEKKAGIRLEPEIRFLGFS